MKMWFCMRNARKRGVELPKTSLANMLCSCKRSQTDRLNWVARWTVRTMSTLSVWSSFTKTIRWFLFTGELNNPDLSKPLKQELTSNRNLQSVDARTTSNLREARLKPGHSLEGRSRVELKRRRLDHIDKFSQAELFEARPNVANLVFWSIGLEDAGRYSCSVDFKRARSRHQAWQLQVVGKFLFSCCNKQTIIGQTWQTQCQSHESHKPKLFGALTSAKKIFCYQVILMSLNSLKPLIWSTFLSIEFKESKTNQQIANLINSTNVKLNQISQ